MSIVSNFYTSRQSRKLVETIKGGANFSKEKISSEFLVKKFNESTFQV